MTTKIKTILIIIGIAGVAGGASLGGAITNSSDITAEKLSQKYEQATEIKSKYQLDGASLKRAVKDDAKDRIEVTIGDNSEVKKGLLGGTTKEFSPKVKIARWDDEVNFTLTPKSLDGVATKDKSVKFENEKIKFETPKVDYQLYELPASEENPEGGFEYEIDLKEKPTSNVVEFYLDTKGLDFFYQPELTQKEKDDGAERPENVIGSYAVYTSEKKINNVEGKEYKTGKVGHIFRPKIIDSAGTEVWGKLNIDSKKGILSVEIPQEFLDKAVYPVKHASGLTFGYTSAGGSSFDIGMDQSGFHYTYRRGYVVAGSAGTLDSISAYMKGSTSFTNTATVLLSIPNNPSSGNHSKLAKIERTDLALTTTLTKYDFTASSEALSSVNYLLNILGNDNPGLNKHIYAAYDNATIVYTSEARNGSSYYYATLRDEDPWSNSLNSEGTAPKISIYATYTPPASARRIIITE